MKTTQQALKAYDALYKSPVTGEHIIDGDEAQVAADLAAIVREQQEILEATTAGMQDSYQQGLEDRPLIDAVAAAVRGITPFEPTRIIESRRAGGAMLAQLAGTDEEQLNLVESLRDDILEKLGRLQPQKPTEFVTEGGCTVRVYPTEDGQTMLSLRVDDGEVASFEAGGATIAVRQAFLQLTSQDLDALRGALA